MTPPTQENAMEDRRPSTVELPKGAGDRMPPVGTDDQAVPEHWQQQINSLREKLFHFTEGLRQDCDHWDILCRKNDELRAQIAAWENAAGIYFMIDADKAYNHLLAMNEGKRR